MYTVHVPASQLLSELGIFSTPGPCASPEQTEPCADNPISQPKRYHRAPRKQIPAQNTALGQPEEELRLLTAPPNRFGFPAVSLPLTTSGFQGQAEPFPCCDIASGRVRRCSQILLLAQHLLRCSHCCPALRHPQWPLGAYQPLGWHRMHPREPARGKGHGEPQGPLPLCLATAKPGHALGYPPLSIGCGAGAELAWCTPPCCHLGWLKPPQDTVWDMGTPHGSLARQPGAVEVHLLTSAIVPAHRHWWSLAAPALSRSEATPCPHGGEGQGGGGAGATGAERTAGHSQLGTGAQMVLPESCSSDQQVTGQERGLLGGEQSR